MKCVGIDLGTSNTLAAIGGELVVLSSEQSAVLPSAVAYPPTGITLVGHRARRRRAIDAKNTICSAKRLIGRAWHAEQVHDFRQRSAVELIEKDGAPAFQTRAGVKTPVDVATTLLASIAEHVTTPPEELLAAVTVPSEFGQPERKATRTAAEAAGFGAVEIVDEPVATARAYREYARPGLGNVAIYDMGGGTFDLAIVDYSCDPMKIVAHGGDLYLGGEDVDLQLAEWAAQQILEQHRWDIKTDPVVFDRLLIQCERAKIRLSYVESTRLPLAQIDPGSVVANQSISLDRAVLTKVAFDLVRRTFAICDRVLADATLKTKDIDAVFMAGGSTLLPPIRDGVAAYFSCSVHSQINPVEIVSLGAGIE